MNLQSLPPAPPATTNMFAQRFLALTAKYPQNAEVLTRLASYFAEIEDKYGDRFKKIKLDPQRLFEISGAGSVYRLSTVISQLTSENLLKRKIVVRYPGGSGVEFDSLEEIPDQLRDPDRDVVIEITSDLISTIYIPVSQ